MHLAEPRAGPCAQATEFLRVWNGLVQPFVIYSQETEKQCSPTYDAHAPVHAHVSRPRLNAPARVCCLNVYMRIPLQWLAMFALMFDYVACIVIVACLRCLCRVVSMIRVQLSLLCLRCFLLRCAASLNVCLYSDNE